MINNIKQELEFHNLRDSSKKDIFIGDSIFEYLRIKQENDVFTYKGVDIARPFKLQDIYTNDIEFMIPKELGIYHLFKNNELVYIGMSKNIRKRLRQHFRDDNKDFDSVLYFIARIFDKNINDITKIEKNMIKYHKPKLNIQHNNTSQ